MKNKQNRSKPEAKQKQNVSKTEAPYTRPYRELPLYDKLGVGLIALSLSPFIILFCIILYYRKINKRNISTNAYK